MWLPSNFGDPSSVHPLTLLIAQAWHELLSSKSPDTFQARVLDLPMMLGELTEVADLCAQDERWLSYLPMIGEELREACQTEARYLSTAPRLRASVDALVAAALVSSESPGLVRERAQIALGLFGSVQRRWTQDALSLVSGDGREKEFILHRLSTLATHVLSRGLEDESLANVSAESCTTSPDAFVEKITSCLSDDFHNFQCVVALEGSRSDLAALIDKTKFVQVGKGRGIRHDDISREWQKSCCDRFFISVTCPALSRRMAAEKCLQEISTLLNVQNLYHNSATFRAVTRVLVYDENSSPHALEVSPAKQFGLFPRSEHRKLTRHTYAQVGERLGGRISNALECHALALSADDPKTAIINLWTALETITGSLGLKPIGARVASRISPVIAYRRVDKIATYLALSVYATPCRHGPEIDRHFLPNSRDDYISRQTIYCRPSPARAQTPRYDIC
jgi:hypothetical protein